MARRRAVRPLDLSVLDVDWKRLATLTPRQRARFLYRLSEKHDERLYQEMQQNPLVAWDAWQCARAVGTLPAPWVLEYFDQVARRLKALRHPDHIPQKNRMTQAVAEACGFQRGRSNRSNAFRQFYDTIHRIAVAGEVRIALTQTKLDFAYDLVVREHPARCRARLGEKEGCTTISRKTVIRYFQQYRHLFLLTPRTRT